MPIRDDEARRAYFRDYMRERRAGKKPLLRADWDTISRVIAHWIKYPSRCKPEFAAKVLRQIEASISRGALAANSGLQRDGI